MPTPSSCAISFAVLCSQSLAQQPVPPPASLAQQPVPSPASASRAPAANGIQWEMGDYTWKLGGYIKVDVIHDFDEIGSTDQFDPRTIPTTNPEDEGGSTRLHARSSRINLDVRGPSSAGDFRAFVEGDFFSDQNGFRLRHAYGEVGPLLGGQTWSTFMDEEAMPETLDYESPIAFPIIRQAQVRWTHRLESGSYYALSLEDPDSDVLAPDGVDGEAEEPLPDVNARMHWKNELGHVQLSLFGGMARFDPDVGSPDDVFLWGTNLSAKVKAFGSDFAMGQVTYGDGVGRYRGGTTAAPDADGDLEAVETLGLMAAYQHNWSEEYRSTVTYSWGEGDVPDGAPPEANEELVYLSANLIWQFTSRAWTGIEYLYGSRDTFDGEDGAAQRVQLAVRFDL